MKKSVAASGSERNGAGQFRRIDSASRPAVRFFLDGVPVLAMEGDTVLTAVLLHKRSLRHFEFDDSERAGFCLMGACQDCWMQREDGVPIRACTTFVEPELALRTRVAANGA